jgi:hypothetical protein
MKFLKIYLLLSLFFFSCKNESSSLVYIHSFQRTQTDKFIVKIKKEKGNIYYKYSNKKDTIKDLNVVFNIKNDILISDKDTFYPIRKEYNTSDFSYKMYQQKVVKSHNRTLVFNKNYGLLSSTALGADFLILKDSLSAIKNEAIFKEIILELHRISK